MILAGKRFHHSHDWPTRKQYRCYKRVFWNRGAVKCADHYPARQLLLHWNYSKYGNSRILSAIQKTSG